MSGVGDSVGDSSGWQRMRDGVALACFFISGSVGLAYEVCWIRKSALAFGVTTFAVSTVLAAFFGGLALGSFLFGRYSRRMVRPLKVYAILEIALGGIGLLSPPAFRAADAFFGVMYPLLQGSFVWLSLTRFVLIVILLLPPTILMGATLPLFCRHFVSGQSRISLSVGLLYGWNTLGAAVGCATCGFILIPGIGVNTTLYLCGTLNILVGVVVWRLRTRAAPQPPAAQIEPAGGAPSPALTGGSGHHVPIVYVMFFLSGFAILGNEVLWTRFLSLIIRNSVHTYTLMLTLMLAGIVVGSVLSCGLFDRSSRRAFIFGGVQVLIGLSVLALLMLPVSWWQEAARGTTMQSQFRIVVVLLVVPAVLSGASFPLAVRMVVDEPALAGAAVGMMGAANMLGGILGCMAIGFLALPTVGMQGALLITTGTSLLIGLGAWLVLERGVGRLTRFSLAIACVGLWLVVPRVGGARLPADYLADAEELVDYREGLSSNLAVIRNNGKTILEIDRLWQGEDRKNHQIMAAHVPMLLHPNPHRVVVVGVGTGQTASRFLMYDIERLDCVDIESALFDLIRKHYDARWLDDGRVNRIIEDGRNYLTHTDARYDVISIEVGQIFRGGAASFYTVEFYREARARLRTGGVLCQFVPIGLFDPDEFRSVLRTFLEVFPTSVLWYNTGELLLIGTEGDELVLRSDVFLQLAGHGAISADLQFAYWGGPAHWLNQPANFVAGFLCGPSALAHLAAGGGVYHDDVPHLEYTISPYPQNTEGAIVELLTRHMDPLTEIVDGKLSEEILSSARVIRAQNMRDILAVAVRRRMSELQVEEDYDEIVEVLRSSLEWNSESLAANRLMGDTLFLGGEYEPAMSYYTTALEIDAGDAAAHRGMASALLSLGRGDEAIRHFLESLRIEPNDAEVHNNLGAMLVRQGEIDGAYVHFEEAVRLKPRYPEAHQNLAIALARLGRSEESVASYRRAVALRPDYAGAHHNLGIVLARLGRVEEALASFDTALRSRPDYIEAWINRSRLLAKLGLTDRAVRGFRSALEIQPANPETHSRLGKLLAGRGDIEEAIKHFRTALELDPDHVDAKADLNEALSAQGAPAGEKGGE